MAISRQMHQRDIRRQMMYNDIRKAIIHHKTIANFVADHIPAILWEFLEMLLGSLLGFWIIGKLLNYTLHINPLYTFLTLGLLYSVQATYYKYQLWTDPNYKIPKCQCANRDNVNTETVLKSKEGTILGVPISVLAIIFYCALPIIMYFGYTKILMPIAIVVFCGSVYLSYVMVIKIGSLCENCVNIIALNMSILLLIFF